MAKAILLQHLPRTALWSQGGHRGTTNAEDPIFHMRDAMQNEIDKGGLIRVSRA